MDTYVRYVFTYFFPFEGVSPISRCVGEQTLKAWLPVGSNPTVRADGNEINTATVETVTQQLPEWVN